MASNRIAFSLAFSVVLSVYVWMASLYLFRFNPFESKSLVLLLFCSGTYLLVASAIILFMRNLKLIARVSIEDLKNPWKQIVALFTVMVGISLGIVFAQFVGKAILTYLTKSEYAKEEFLFRLQFTPFVTIPLSIVE